jgi:hypothetical protein
VKFSPPVRSGISVNWSIFQIVTWSKVSTVSHIAWLNIKISDWFRN